MYVKTLLVKYPGSTISVTGASLGGALAVISSVELQHQTKKVSELYNYGTPRVGNKNFASYVDTAIPTRYRIVYNGDLVPHVPFLELGFRHNAN